MASANDDRPPSFGQDLLSISNRMDTFERFFREQFPLLKQDLVSASTHPLVQAGDGILQVVTDLGTRLSSDITSLRTDVNASLDQLRADMVARLDRHQTELNEIRTRMATDKDQQRLANDAIRTQINTDKDEMRMEMYHLDDAARAERRDNISTLRCELDYRLYNNLAILANGSIRDPEQSLTPLRSQDNQPIANFPAHIKAIESLPGATLDVLLISLGVPVPNLVSEKKLEFRRAIGLLSPRP